MSAPLAEVPAGTLDAQTLTVHRIAATVAQLVEREGSAPSAIVLSVADDERLAHSGLPDLVARHLGLGPDQVRLITATEATRLSQARTGGGSTTMSAGAIGAALSGATFGSSGPLLAAAGGALAGGAGAALLADGSTSAAPAAAGIGPTGAPLGPSTLAGPTGTPLGPSSVAGPAGTPLGPSSLAGPTGMPLGTTPVAGPTGAPLAPASAVGPTGVPLAPPSASTPVDAPVPSAGAVARRSRVPLIAGAVAVVVVAVGAIAVAAGGNDSPAAAPTVAQTLAPTPTDAVVEVTAAPSSTGATDTTGLGVTVPAGSSPAAQYVAPCVVGSWLADNSTISSGIFSVLPAEVSGLIEVGASTGSVVLDIAADGTLSTTFDNFSVSANLTDGSASVASTASGKESGTSTFADDGSFSGDITQSETHLQVTFNGAVMFDGLAPVPIFHGSGTYTCTKDQLQITHPGDPLVPTYSRNG